MKERFVMINAWNDWANGAYLEPDDRFGYAYLAACGSAISEHIQPDERVSELFAAQRDRFRPSRRQAVVLHLFYEDLAEEFAVRIARLWGGRYLYNGGQRHFRGRRAADH